MRLNNESFDIFLTLLFKQFIQTSKYIETTCDPHWTMYDLLSAFVIGIGETRQFYAITLELKFNPIMIQFLPPSKITQPSITIIKQSSFSLIISANKRGLLIKKAYLLSLEEIFHINEFIKPDCNFIAYLQKLILKMGCGTSDPQGVKLNKKRQTVFGVLEIKLIQAVIERETSHLFTMDPYVNVKLSNQVRNGTVVKNGGKNPRFTDIFKLIVNSCFKYYGRCLEIELMDNNIGSDSLIGYGIIDLDPYLNALQVKSPESSPGQTVLRQPQQVNLRCFLNFDRKQIGFVTLTATFKQQKCDVINFRFETAEFTRSTRTFGQMNCSIRVTIGEQILQTQKSKDTKTNQPVWKNEHLSFMCPASVETVLIEVMDEDEVVGSIMTSKLDFLVDSSKEQEFDRPFNHKNSPAGKLKFNTLLDHNPIFKELKGDYVKKIPEKQENKVHPQSKKQQVKGEQKKGEQKKPQQKKPQQKKPQPQEPQKK